MKRILTVIGVGSVISRVFAADPQIASWFTTDSGNYARIYRTDTDRANGQSMTTWSNGRLAQQQPAFSGVQEILSSEDWIYVRSTGLGSHVMGPWYDDWQRIRSFPNLPTDQHLIYRFPRHPKYQTSLAFQPLGEIGMTVDGVRMFDSNDAFSYSTADGRDAGPQARIGQGDRVWNRDAYANERVTFDPALGHQQNWGRYHYHSEPIALRYLLGDHVDFDAATKTYSESKSVPTKHSPILGWMQDGFPLYGPYGFSNKTNAASGVRRMVSGFALRNGSNGTDNLSQMGRHTLPKWTAREFGSSGALNQNEFGPNISAAFPLGRYIEDYAFLGDCGKKQGADFDLDEFNGRWCVTPEFPNGTYAYFTTIDANGQPVYPYNMGRRYRGIPGGSLVNTIPERVITNFVAHAMTQKTPGAVTMKWNSTEGGYQAGSR